jgi:uncharacterized membrane protein (UPF0127 family)
MLRVQVADNPYALERGLMFVDHLPEDEGMLFVFPRTQKLSFWGKNTLIPLDIAFIDDKRRVTSISTIKPFSLSAVCSDGPCSMAVEANAGYFEKHKIKVGDKVEIKYDSTLNDTTVSFGGLDNIEGTGSDKQKDKRSVHGNMKRSQTVVPQPVTPPVASQPSQPPAKVEKPGVNPVGAPIGEQPEQANLPVMTPQDIGSYLEDTFDESDAPELQPGQPGVGEPIVEEQPLETEPVEEPGQTEPDPQDYPQFQTAFDAVQWAEQNNEVVHISYTTKRGRQLERDVEPHGQFHSESTSRQILVTFDESVGDIRAFIISNIGSWTFTGRKFTKKFVVKG